MTITQLRDLLTTIIMEDDVRGDAEVWVDVRDSPIPGKLTTVGYDRTVVILGGLPMRYKETQK